VIEALLLSAALAAAPPGCTAARAEAGALDDAALAGRAPALARALRDAAPDEPAAALLAEAVRAAEEPGPASGARFRAALARQCELAAEPRLPAAGGAERLRAKEILDRPAFRRARGDARIVRLWLLRLWERLLGLFETREAQRYARFSQIVFLAAVACAIAAGAWALLRRRPGAARPMATSAAALAPAPDARLGAAAEAAARGEAALAVRLSMLAALGALERDAALPAGRSLTGTELVAHVRVVRPDGAEAARTLCAIFDRTIYGGRPAGAAEAEAALAAARALGSGVEA
jgi:hypothetical protein